VTVPAQHRVGDVIQTVPSVRRVSRTKAFRGYLLTIFRGVKEDGTLDTFDVFKPAHLYDRAVLATNKYQPHQGKREIARRLAKQPQENT
jgi:ribosomal protein S17